MKVSASHSDVYSLTSLGNWQSQINYLLSLYPTTLEMLAGRQYCRQDLPTLRMLRLTGEGKWLHKIQVVAAQAYFKQLQINVVCVSLNLTAVQV